MYKVELSKTAEKQIHKLSKDLQKRVILTLNRIKVRPYAYVKKLVSSPYFSLRFGDYRVILNIQDNKLIIFVIELGHRRNIYKK
ncbi:type II toxin-antitoxin system RelE/ParE family toxin [Candidatus Woesearchaeota archaeon]|jgi:mRNA interferase RelE/StbE|nr:type II toxin-antitoxin system RelE/ParE family toxin [Candidatus Woesearchaeota archaeon]MBT4110907.1 type II toxin-antitoxin system RelE/ParE family toxin [Candidatus Woesearchaeota archaeon]MBT4336581.1 type II toxin-antitoxin system RelE/ParE family toxin [Candidatus Woesearchaeota archaeon]MBT4469670.1 type II toxin-antitoxin system RelE/ParE family toxin [Candidatus Woesearchaeota archaeon]MBT6744032.1 type II toxin-antitoxin system RelE/ParE family toxin [Candidatus Woesearchaeota arc